MWEGKSVLTKTDRKCEGCWLVKLGSLLSEPIIILRGMGYTSRNHIKNSSNWVIQNCFHTAKWNPVFQSKIRGTEYINFLLLWKKLPKFDGLKQFHLLFYSFHGLGVLAQLNWVLCTGSQAAEIHILPGTAFSSEAQGLLPSSKCGQQNLHSWAAVELMADCFWKARTDIYTVDAMYKMDNWWEPTIWHRELYLLLAPWCPVWKRNPKRREYMYMYDCSFWYAVEANTKL